MSGEPDPPPPVLGSWGALYAVVLGDLALTVLLMWWLTRAWS